MTQDISLKPFEERYCVLLIIPFIAISYRPSILHCVQKTLMFTFMAVSTISIVL